MPAPTDGLQLTLVDLLPGAFPFGPLQARRLPPSSSRIGSHRSRLQGRGMEFDEVRLYQAGDDVRLIDWLVTARTGRPHTKLFREEREQPNFLLLDCSPSMFFATQGQLKVRLAACLVAQLAWRALKNQDRVALWFAGARTYYETAPKEHRQALLQMLGKFVEAYQQELQGLQEEGFISVDPSPLRKLLERFNRVQRPGHVVWLFSDFQQFGEDEWKLCRRLVRHCELRPVCLLDPLEQQMSWRGEILFQQDTMRLTLNWGESRNKEFQRQFKAWQQGLQEKFHQLNRPIYWMQTTDEGANFQTSISSTASL